MVEKCYSYLFCTLVISEDRHESVKVIHASRQINRLCLAPIRLIRWFRNLWCNGTELQFISFSIFILMRKNRKYSFKYTTLKQTTGWDCSSFHFQFNQCATEVMYPIKCPRKWSVQIEISMIERKHTIQMAICYQILKDVEYTNFHLPT